MLRPPAARFLNNGASMFAMRALVLVLFFGVWALGTAQAGLTIEPTTWNVVGLDSNNTNSGPATFPVGARVCNTGGAAVTNVTGSLVWDTFNTYINLTGASTLNVSSLAAGACVDFYFPVTITRTSAAYDATRRYHITATGDSVASVSTPTPREIYVEKIISQGRNAVNSITGPTTVYVGQTYTYTVNASTATGGYEQLQAFLELPNVIFQVQSIATTYTAPSGGTNNKFYADACGWDNNPLSGSYRDCIGPNQYSGGKAGGTVVTTYTVKVISAGTTTAGTVILDFSGSSYHYNNDYGARTISITALPPPLTLSKIANPATATAGATVTYTLRVVNSGTPSYTLTDFVDTPPTSPASPTYVAGSSTFNGAPIADPVTSGSTRTWTGSFLVPANQTRDLTYQMVMPNTPGAYVNTAIAHFNEYQIDTTQTTTDNAPASATVTIPPPDMTITKTHVGNFTQGQVGATYSITATNSGSAPTSAAVSVTDTLPAGLTATAISGTGWTCVLGTLTCTRSDALAAGASYPVITLTVNVANNAAASVTNSVSVSGGGQTNTANDTATDPTTVNQLPDMTITKSHVGNFTQGQVGATYTLTARNSGFAATSGTVTVTDTLPAGLTATAISGTGWTCVLGTLTCTRNDALAINTNYPPITVTVNVANNAPASVTNTANVSGGGQTNTANDSASDPTTVNQLPDLTISKSHVGNFTQGQVGATYSITATNSGFAATSGVVTVTDTLPAGLTATAISGSGWSCVLGTLTCTRNDALATGSSYPIITLTVNVANNAAASVTNSVSVSGGGQTNTTNDTATDPTTINQLPDLTIAKSHVGNFTQGQVGATYSITATNSGFASTSGMVTVTDTLPAGLTATAISGTGWSCVLGTLTCTRSDALAAGSSYPVITLTVDVAFNAAASVTNSVTISGGGETNATNNTASDPTTVNQRADMTITKTHTGNFIVGQVGATYTITARNSGFAATSGVVTVTDTLPAGLTATAMAGTGWTCVLGTLTCTRNDALAINTDYPAITLTVTVAANAPASVTNSVSVSGGNQVNTSNDTASDPTTIDRPDMTIAKSHTGNFTQGQVGATYTLTATNSGTAATNGNTVTVTDTLPAGLTATAISGSGWTCVLGTLTCTRSDALAVVASYPAITLTVNVANNAPASVTNSATVSGGGQTNTANDTATDPTTVNQLPDMTITKSHVGNFTQGQVGATYTITATNSGFAATTGAVSVTDTLPAGLTATAISGSGWTCVLGTLTCTRSDALAAGSSYPVITLTVTVANNAPASVTNTANVSGGGQTNTANDSASDPTTVNQLPDLTISKSHVGNFTQGQVGATYSITATNSGFAATSGVVTVTDTLPAGLTATAISGSGWSCVLGTLTCTRNDALAAGSSYPVITLTVDVANNAPANVTNSVSISGGGQTNTGNDNATDPTVISQLPDLTISKSHVGNFSQGQTGATYSITVNNSGSSASSGMVSVTDTLPAGLTATGISGTGWTCVLGTLTCTRNDPLAAAASYPAITLTVDVAGNAPASVTNSVTVSGGGETNAANNTANDPTNITQLPDLTIAKSHTGDFTQGQIGATYSIVVTNAGSAATSGVITVTDTLPASLTATSIAGTGWSCVLGTLTCTRSDVLAAGASYPAITLTVDVSPTAPAVVTNTASVSGPAESNSANNTANDLTTINAAAPPDIDLVKSVSPNGSQAPGTDLNYTIVYTNNGGQPATNFILVDPNAQNVDPLERVFHNVDFKVGSMTSTPGSTGLVASFEYSSDGGLTWTYTPVSGGGSAPAGYDRNVTNVRWVFAGNLSHIGPNNSGSVDFVVRIR